MLDKAKFTCDYTDLTAKVPGVLQTFHRSLELVLFLKSCSKWHLKLFLFQTFCLNWGKVTCDNSKEHQAVKYTDLGPFSPGWMLKCKSNENKGMPSTLVACIRVSHFKTQESIHDHVGWLNRSHPDKTKLRRSNGDTPGWRKPVDSCQFSIRFTIEHSSHHRNDKC